MIHKTNLRRLREELDRCPATGVKLHFADCFLLTEVIDAYLELIEVVDEVQGAKQRLRDIYKRQREDYK